MSDQAPDSTGEPINILLVDDRPSNLLSLQSVLELPGYNLVLADSGHEALRQVLRHELALIMMDVAMPGMDGFETATLLRQTPRYSLIPIIFVTASVYDVENVFRGYTVGAVDYLGKPLDPHAVRAKVRVFAELFRQKKQIERQADLLRESDRRERELEVARLSLAHEKRRQLLAEATSTLLASLEMDETLGAVAKLAVPRLADWCVVDVLEDGHVRQAAVVHSDADLAKRLADYRQTHNPSDVRDSPAARALAHAHAEIATRPRDALLDGSDAESEAQLGHLRLVSAMVVPLVARGKALGTLTLVTGESGRRYEPDDLTMAEEMAKRAAIAVDNARLYGEARAAVRLREEFLSVASHELRTPLTSLLLQLQALERTLRNTQPEPRAVAAKIETTLRQAKRLAVLVDDLLDVSRMTAGRPALERQEMDLAATAAEVIERLRDQAQRVACSLELHAPAPVVGSWDRGRIEQVLTNLVANALKYAPGKPVRVVVEGDETTARLSVSDEGIGISEQDAGRIFGRFERAVPVTNYGGLGLGLYIVREIVQAHGGAVRVDSRPGLGSRFSVDLPRRAARDETETAPSSTQRKTG